MSKDSQQLLKLQKELQSKVFEQSKNNLLSFSMLNLYNFQPTKFHTDYYKKLDDFAKGKIKKLMVFVPPQHGKSEGSSKQLPAYLLGRNPSLRIAIATYSDTFAKKFNRAVQRIIDSDVYRSIFPNTQLGSAKDDTQRTANEFEVVDNIGSLKAVGVGGGLTGNPVDIGIIDDVFKDSEQAFSPVIREKIWEWYVDVFKSRLHNDSQQLIVYTRWHEDDLAGRILKIEKDWEVVVYEAIKTNKDLSQVYEGVKITKDDRKVNTALWTERHNIESLEDKRKLSPSRFDALYQQDPKSKDDLLYSDGFDFVPPHYIKEGARVLNQTDTADKGDDYFCSLFYYEQDKEFIIFDCIYTQDGVEKTRPKMSNKLIANNVNTSKIEANNGGRIFGLNIQSDVKSSNVAIITYHQSKNKESKILNNADSVMQRVKFIEGFTSKSKECELFYNHLTNFRRKFKANKQDDSADTITEIVLNKKKTYTYV